MLKIHKTLFHVVLKNGYRHYDVIVVVESHTRAETINRLIDNNRLLK